MSWRVLGTKLDENGGNCRQDGAKMGQDGAKMGHDGAKLSKDAALSGILAKEGQLIWAKTAAQLSKYSVLKDRMYTLALG